MTKYSKDQIYEEQRKLVLARFGTLNPESKLLLGSREELTVKDLIQHITEDDEFGKKIVQVQIKMLQILASA